MALGKAIVSTEIGAEGINCAHGKNILLANTPEEFLNAIEKFASSKTYCKEMGNNARKLIEDYHNLTHITQKLLSFYQRVLEN